MIYKTQGTCCTEIKLETDDGIITSVSFTNGCNGNLKGIVQLVTGLKAEDVIKKVNGITCGSRPTSCPDQLAKALQQHRPAL